MNFPEHEKLKQVQEKSQVIGEFLDWLQGEKGVTLAKHHKDRELPMFPTCVNTEKLLAEFFEID